MSLSMELTVEWESLLAEKKRIDRRLQQIMRMEAEQAPHQDIGINQMTPDVWKSMARDDRRAWTNYWRIQGQVSFTCLSCGFPTASGQSSCEACR